MGEEGAGVKEVSGFSGLFNKFLNRSDAEKAEVGVVHRVISVLSLRVLRNVSRMARFAFWELFGFFFSINFAVGGSISPFSQRMRGKKVWV